MTLLEFIVYLVIAGICGAIARAIAGGTGGGFVISVLLGFLGAFVGTWLARLLHLPELLVIAVQGHPFPIVWSILGGILLVALAHALTRPRYTYVR
ncbi:MAG: GlsB/YeaQ/YmgE family stress response membrane protein [Myxococcales bacterium]|nr:GlsB/YeaQ/YmgE family stress response membrane protein [Myxococcales bacterium]